MSFGWGKKNARGGLGGRAVQTGTTGSRRKPVVTNSAAITNAATPTARSARSQRLRAVSVPVRSAVCGAGRYAKVEGLCGMV